MKIRKRILVGMKYVALNILLFICIFAVLEIGIRSWSCIRGNGFFRESKFISPWITTYESPSPKFNSRGQGIFRHRDVVIAKEKQPGTIRIIAVGGSTTANEKAYSQFGIDYQSVLEDLLNKRNDGKIYEVLNAGATAYSTAQSLINIEFRLVEFDPDIIILMHNINDLTVNIMGGSVTADYSNKYLEPYYINPQLQAGLSFQGLLIQSRLLCRLGLPQLLARRNLTDAGDIQYGRELFERNLSHIIGICKLHNTDVILLSQPRSTKKPKYKIRDNDFLLYNETIHKTADKHNVHFVDMHDKMGQDEKYFIDDFHYSRDGIYKFAELLCPEVINVVEKHR